MDWLIIVLLISVLSFGSVVFFGAPYLPSKKQQIKAALDLLDLKPGQTMLELGCGDGRVLKEAASRGIKCVGYELNLALVIAAKLHTRKYSQNVTVKWGNYWRATWPPADGIYVFLLDSLMSKLDRKIIKQQKLQGDSKIKLVSFAFKIPGKKIAKTKNGVFLYQYK